jgi:hypothetical protein
MQGFAANATSMEVGTRIIEWAGGELCPVETELLAAGGEHGMLGSGVGAEGGEGLACKGLFCVTVSWEMA